MHVLPPRYDLWPLPVQRAMLLRGALIECGPGLRGAGWPDCPKVRLAALGAYLTRGVVAAHLTAAWVWEAASSPGSPLSVAAVAGSARTNRIPGIQRCEMRFQPDDVIRLGEFGTTSPRRTLHDLLHRPSPFGEEEREACAGLLSLIEEPSERIVHTLDTTRRPHARLARQRIRELLGQQPQTLP